MKPVRLTVELTPDQAAALYRVCDKLTHGDAAAMLPPGPMRGDKAYEILYALEVLRRSLEATGRISVDSWMYRR